MRITENGAGGAPWCRTECDLLQLGKVLQASHNYMIEKCQLRIPVPDMDLDMTYLVLQRQGDRPVQTTGTGAQ